MTSQLNVRITSFAESCAKSLVAHGNATSLEKKPVSRYEAAKVLKEERYRSESFSIGKCVCSSGMKECRCGKEKLVRLVFAKPIKADPDEVTINVRARSAKLRVVEKIAVVS